MKVMVFDLDGTLVDSHSVYYDSLAAVLQTYNSTLTEEDKTEILRISVKERINFLKRKLGVRYASEALKMLEIKLCDDYLKTKPFPGIEDLLKSLQENKIKLAVWTARELSSAKKLLEHTGLQDYFSACVSGTCVSVCKPNPEGLIRVSEQLGIKTTETIMVGDHDNDMIAAKACGAKAIRAYWHNPNLPFACTMADWMFNQVSDFNHWVSEVYD